MARGKDTTGRITVYRLKEKAELGTARVEGYERVAEGTESASGYRYALWFGDYGTYTPDWFPPFKGVAKTTPKVRQAGFVLLVNTSDATYSCTGGLGYHRLLECFRIEPRFGIAVAKKILAVPELRGLVQKDASGIVNNLDRVFRGTYNPEGDIDNLHRVLTTLRASFSKDSAKYAEIGSRIRAGDSLAANKARDFEGIFAFIRSVDDLWKSDEPGIAIPELEHISTKHEPDLLRKLKQELATMIRDGHTAPSPTPLPLFLDNIGMGYLPDRAIEYKVIRNRKATICASHTEVFDVLGGILEAYTGHADLLYSELEATNIRIKFDDSEGFQKKAKPVMHYICGDVVLDGEAYFVNNGLWFRANEDFIKKIDHELDQVKYVSPGELDLKDWTESGKTAERTYNLKHKKDGIVVLDCRLVKIDQESGPIEFCDLLHHGDDERICLVHVKNACGAALRALFAQGYVSAQLYSESDEFRDKVHSADVKGKDGLSDEERKVLAGLSEFGKPMFTVVYAIFDDTPSHAASTISPRTIGEALGKTITLFAKIDLLGRVQAIRAMGYHVAVTRIPPYPKKTS